MLKKFRVNVCQDKPGQAKESLSDMSNVLVLWYQHLEKRCVRILHSIFVFIDNYVV